MGSSSLQSYKFIFDNAGMESGECSRMIGRCTEHFFCLKIGKIDVTGSDVDIGVIALCQFLISTAVILIIQSRIVFGIALIKILLPYTL